MTNTQDKFIFPKYRAMSLVYVSSSDAWYLRTSPNDYLGIVARVDGNNLVELNLPWNQDVKKRISYASKILGLELIHQTKCKSPWANKIVNEKIKPFKYY